VPDHLDRLKTALASRYLIDREIGSGGMATVYLAEDLRHHRKVAVKVLRPEIAVTLGSERFFREIEVAARLQHPHILPLLDSGEAGPEPGGASDSFFYYVMPFIQGESLRERLAREGELPIHDAVRILSEVVDALATAHAEGVVHRDIKPDNVMLSGRHALVTDFGVAKAVSEATGRQSLTTAGVALGTPAYMAPEQAVADPHLDHRVDLYAVGVMGYEMLTGHPPFHGRSPQEILSAHVTLAPEPVTRRREAVPGALEAVLMRCLEKRPADRWQSAQDLLRALEPLATPSAGVTPSQTRPVSAVTTEASRRSVPRWVAWLAGGAVVAGGALAMSLIQRTPATITLGKRWVVAAGPAREHWPSISPDGRTVVYALTDATASKLFVQQVDGGKPVAVTSSLPGWQLFGAMSPDGTRLLFLGEDGLSVIPTLGGQVRRVVPRLGARDNLSWGNWAPDGKRIAYVARDTVFTQALEHGDPVPVATGTGAHSPAWSTDGSWIAFVEGNSDFHLNGNNANSRIEVVRATGGPPVPVTDAAALNISPIWVPGQRSLLFISDREGGRDIYQVFLAADGKPRGPPTRLTTGLSPERISLSADGRRLAWSVFTQTSNVWEIPIPAHDSVPLSHARRVTSGTQDIESAAVSADGRWLYYDSDLTGNPDLWRQPLPDGTPERLTTDSAPEFACVPSPDGRELAFHALRNGHRSVFVMPAGGGPATRVSGDVGQAAGPQWSPDGRALAWQDLGGRAPRTWVAQRQPDGSWTVPQALNVPWAGSWSADGRALIYLGADDSVGLFDLATATVRLLVSHWPGMVDSLFQVSPDGRTIYAATERDGRLAIQAVSLPGGRPRTLVYADDPLNQRFRFGLAVSEGRLYLPVQEASMDVWVAEVGPR
jgi:eukaryotic-like serine/threonine-protein kinase